MRAQNLNPALALADQWQRGFPVQREPFAQVAAAAELSEREVLAYMQQLCDQGVLARIGATVRPNTVGSSTLAAMAVPQQRVEDYAQVISGHPAVNHNYEREHPINLWFVVTAGNRSEVLDTLADIAQQCGTQVLDLPLERAYHIDLGFRLVGQRGKPGVTTKTINSFAADRHDVQLLSALESGLDLVRRPYAKLAMKTGLDEGEVLVRLSALIDAGVVTRFGCILRHRKLGFRANAMAVWDVPDTNVDNLAEQLAQRGEVTLCYRRTRREPVWPYNLFAMIHGRDRDTVRQQVAQAGQSAGLTECRSAVLFSNRCFKQSAARISPRIRGAA